MDEEEDFSADDAAVIEVVGANDPLPTRVMSTDAARRIVDLLVALPSGVLCMDERLSGIVRTNIRPRNAQVTSAGASGRKTP